MTEVYKDIPAWFWLLLFLGGGVVIGSLLTILVWFLKRFLEDNKESWKEIKNAVANLVTVTTKHDSKLFELEKDIMQLSADVHDRPFVQEPGRRKR